MRREICTSGIASKIGYSVMWLKVGFFSPGTYAVYPLAPDAQVFMASRFVISNVDDFDAAREFAATVGTDKYAPYWRDRRGS